MRRHNASQRFHAKTALFVLPTVEEEAADADAGKTEGKKPQKELRLSFHVAIQHTSVAVMHVFIIWRHFASYNEHWRGHEMFQYI